jgi:hypothetical protein
VETPDPVKDRIVTDATVPEADGDTGSTPIADAYADVPLDAIYMGDTAACGPCMNMCIPSFVPCCLPEGGCGCIEFFFPVVCQ